MQPVCCSHCVGSEQGSVADLSLYHTARRLSHSVALSAARQGLCPCQRNPEDANVPLRGDNAEVATRELIDTSNGHKLQGSWQHWHDGMVPGVFQA